MEVYESEFGGSLKNMENIPFLKDIHCFTFLNDEPSHCKARVEEVRKHESEQGIPLPYYEGIDDIHFSVFMELLSKNLSKILVLNWGDYDNAEIVFSKISNILSGVQSTPKVDYVNSLKKRDKNDHVALYSSPQEILKAYKSIKENKNPFEGKIKEAWIPRNALIVEYEEKKVLLEHAKPYGILFYQNEYKRVVFWHLSKFHKIVFYNKLV